MKKLLALFLISVFSITGIAVTDAKAVGLGFFLEKGTGSGESTTYDVFISGNDIDDDYDTDHFALGFQLDTNPFDEGTFNYRLSVGVDSIEGDADSGNDVELDGLTIENDFGFRVGGNDKIRIWIGPEVRVGFYEGDNDAGGDLDLVSLGVGPVVGANFGVSDSVAITVKAGYIFSAFYGEVDYSFDSYDYTGEVTMLFISAGMLFIP
ncbi:MAG: porin family protein [Deltaproteobacteria bacterium]|nr:porin family protein [Deltaproteobacteria bacterium]